MVHQPTQPGEIKAERKHSKAFYVFADFIVLLLFAGATFTFLRLTFIRPENRSDSSKVEGDNSVESGLEGQGWLSRAISGWLETLSKDSKIGIEVYDLDNETKLGGVFTEKVFPSLSETVFEKTFNPSDEERKYISADDMTDSVKLAFKHTDMTDEDWDSFKHSLVALSSEECSDECYGGTGFAAGFSSDASSIYGENYFKVEDGILKEYRDLVLVELTTKSGLVRNFAIALIGQDFRSQSEFQTLGEILEKVMLAHIESE